MSRIERIVVLELYITIYLKQGQIESFCQPHTWTVKDLKAASFSHEEAKNEVKY